MLFSALTLAMACASGGCLWAELSVSTSAPVAGSARGIQWHARAAVGFQVADNESFSGLGVTVGALRSGHRSLPSIRPTFGMAAHLERGRAEDLATLRPSVRVYIDAIAAPTGSDVRVPRARYVKLSAMGGLARARAQGFETLFTYPLVTSLGASLSADVVLVVRDTGVWETGLFLGIDLAAMVGDNLVENR